MVMRKTGIVLVGLLVLTFLVVATWPYLSYQIRTPGIGITGNSISEAVSEFYEMSSVNHRVFILSQIALLVVIVVIIVFVFKKFRAKERLRKSDYLVKDSKDRAHTDLDVLYEMLKKRKEIDLEDIEMAFRVSPDVALGWAKILENGNLAELDYPRFGKPVLRLFVEQEKDKCLVENPKEEKKEKRDKHKSKEKKKEKKGKNILKKENKKPSKTEKNVPKKKIKERKVKKVEKNKNKK